MYIQRMYIWNRAQKKNVEKNVIFVRPAVDLSMLHSFPAEQQKKKSTKRHVDYKEHDFTSLN